MDRYFAALNPIVLLLMTVASVVLGDWLTRSFKFAAWKVPVLLLAILPSLLLPSLRSLVLTPAFVVSVFFTNLVFDGFFHLAGFLNRKMEAPSKRSEVAPKL
jgi:hypothetical protein